MISPNSAFRALRHRNYRLYATGQAVSLTGSWVQNTALAWLMYRLTHSEWMLGLMSVCTNLPVLLLGGVAGVAADRWPRRRIVFATQSLFLAQALALAVLTALGRERVSIVLMLGLTFGVANAFDIPARQAMLLDLSSAEDLISAVSLNSLFFNLARIVGPGLGAAALATLGESWCFRINALSFLAVLMGLLLMRIPNSKPAARTADWNEGLAFVLGRPVAWRLLLLCALMNIAFSGVFVLNPFFADQVFHQGVWGLGAIPAAIGLGAVVGTYFLARTVDANRLPRVSVWSGLLLGASLCAYAVAPHILLALPMMAVAGGCLMRQNAATNSSLQSSVPPDLRGRIVALFGMSVVGMAPIGSAVFGALARWTGVRMAALLAGLLCMGAAALVRSGLRRAGALVLLMAIASSGWSQDLRKQVDEHLKQVSQYTGFSVKRSVPSAMITREELEKYLRSKMKDEVDDRKVLLEELVLKRFGFAPESFQLKETTVNLLKEQAAAFYDFKEKRLYVLDSGGGEIADELLVHELGHALADQHFCLKCFLKGAKGDDDASLARMAVMEGQAMYLMGEHAARGVGLKLKDSPALIERLSRPDDSADDLYPVMKTVPLYLKESLLFPYAQGFRFQAAVCAQHEDCMRRVFETPPASSAQVMHPELYFQGVKPEKISAPAAPARGWKQRAAGSFGEIDASILLRTFRRDASIAEGWAGGEYALFEHKKTRYILLTHASRWKDEAYARRWFAAYAELLASKWKKLSVTVRQPDLWEGTGDHGGFRLTRRGRDVLVEEGLPVN